MATGSHEPKRTGARAGRFWIIGGVALVLAVILGANAHMLYVALSSQPGCAEATVVRDGTDGSSAQVLQAAKAGC